MSQLKLIIKNEYLTDVKSKSFWIASIVGPLVIALFGVVMGFLMAESDSAQSVMDKLPTTPEEDTLTPLKAVGMMMGLMLTLFLMMYGASIFNKVKNEKCNRIVEILATCVEGRTMMLAKIISVGLVGLTQMLVWAILIAVFASGVVIVFNFDIPWHYLLHPKFWATIFWMFAYFIGGYIFYGSLYAVSGAMTDKDNENQIYMSLLTFMLLACFYIGQYAVDNGSGIFARVCAIIPFTSPTIGCVNAVTESVPWWETAISLIVLYISAYISLIFAGKVYTCSLLLKGKNFTPRDIIVFLKSK